MYSLEAISSVRLSAVRERLKLLLQFAERDQWRVAGDIYAAVALEAKGSDEQFRIDALAPYIRLRDSRNLRLLVKRLLKSSAV